MKDKYETVLGMLDSENDPEVQAEGLIKARKIKDLRVFLQPGFPFGIGTWDNCALIISERDDKEIKDIIDSLFEWIQDMNHPGAETIYQRLLRTDPREETLKFSLEKSLLQATESNDHIWRKTLKDFYYDYCSKHSLNADFYIDRHVLINRTEEILLMLDSRNSEDIQQQGINLASDIDIEFLLQYEDGYVDRHIWRNCAIVLSNKTDEDIKCILFYLIRWMKDIESPGAYIIRDRLEKYKDKKELMNIFDKMR